MSISPPFQVILSANVTHYYYAALALHRAGLLRRYICAIGIGGRHKWFRKLAKGWLEKYPNRDFSAFRDSDYRSIWIPEILQRGLPALRLISPEQGNRINSELYDRMALRYIEPCDLFHFVSGIGYRCARKARELGSKVVCDFRAVYPDSEVSILREEYERLGLEYRASRSSLMFDIYKREFSVSDYLILPSQYARETFIQAGMEPEKIFVVPYGVELGIFNQGSGFEAVQGEREKDIFRVIYAGRLIPEKGIFYLIEAFNKLEIPDSELILVGHIDPSVQPLLDRHQSKDPRIKIIGQVSKQELAEYYRGSSVFVFPSLFDSFGLVILEAMASSLPVIATENSGSREAIRDGVEGFIVPIRNADAIAEKLVWLYQHPDFRKDMAIAARARAQDFSWDCYGERLLQTFTQIVNQ